ncbi:MAG: cation:proton antiporter [Gammaproteobacteria bacterium]|nr:cation:proton antiporter [Gammaproteobacteria bacterium]MDE0302242.1 cation:proton antiporter [Gammaproteobacteria bacterium]MDE0612186.1 cation:proton antiporter [Gammaproteobacteria bacterium]
MTTDVVFTIFLIFTGAAVLATLSLFARQTMLIAYILLGLIVGPFGAGLVADTQMVENVSHIGIMFLLFLLGLNLEPQKLLHLFRKTAVITGITSGFFAAGSGAICYALGFSLLDCVFIGAGMMFSSTIIGLKLLPTTVLHHQITGELMISILLLQDLLAIIILILIELMSTGGGEAGAGAWEILSVLLSLPLLAVFALLFQRYVLTPLFARFDQIQEYIFLLVIGWCLGVAELAAVLGLSAETGAFIAGVAVASSPIAKFVAEVLKPLRDFFLVIFFFAVGAGYNWQVLLDVLLPAVLLTAFVMTSKPWLFRTLLCRAGEKEKRAHAVGVRLANASEFSLLIAVLALAGGVISENASYVIQTTVLFTFIISSYWIVMFYPSPMAVSDELRQL